MIHLIHVILIIRARRSRSRSRSEMITQIRDSNLILLDKCNIQDSVRSVLEQVDQTVGGWHDVVADDGRVLLGHGHLERGGDSGRDGVRVEGRNVLSRDGHRLLARNVEVEADAEGGREQTVQETREGGR